MLADAQYAEEMEEWTFAALTHGSDGVKKWPQPTLSTPKGMLNRVRHQTRGSGLTSEDVAKAGIYVPPDFSEKKQERMAFYEKATGGRRIIWSLDDGSYVDRLGNPVSELRESDLILHRRTGNG